MPQSCQKSLGKKGLIKLEGKKKNIQRRRKVKAVCSRKEELAAAAAAMTVSPSLSVARNGRVLIVGATGFIGRFVAEASLAAGRPTYVLVRPGPLHPSKADTVKSFKHKGAIILHGLISDKTLMEKILRELEIETVISAVGGATILDQIALVEAIAAVGTVKRFLPSEFGHDVDRADPVEPGLTMYVEKRKVRRWVEKSGVAYTYICCNSIASWPYFDNTHPSEVLPPLDRFQIYGDGTVKAYFVDGTDIGKFTIKTVDDIRTINKNVHFRPPSNLYDINGLASLWEKKIGRTLPRITITENHLLALAAENRIPESIVASFTHDIFIKGCQVNFAVEGPRDVEVGTLYPGDSFRTLDECFNDFLLKLKDNLELVHEEKDQKVPTKTPSSNPGLSLPLVLDQSIRIKTVDQIHVLGLLPLEKKVQQFGGS